MNYQLKNDKLAITVSSLGAELISLKKDNFEYLWQGDETYWKSHSTNLFPICGRLTDGKYTFEGKTYEMMLHGFAKISEFKLEKETTDSLLFTMHENEETLKMYPFEFTYSVEFKLKDSELFVTYIVNNNSQKAMYFTLGGHPGFNIPFGCESDFSEYYIEFSKKCDAKQLVMDHCYMSDELAPFPLIDGMKKYLSHDMFDNDAIFLCDTAKEVSLKCDKSKNKVTLKFPDMKYVGLWHKPETKAPYVCIEPWLGVPSYYNKIDQLTEKRDMIKLDANKEFKAGYSIEID